MRNVECNIPLQKEGQTEYLVDLKNPLELAEGEILWGRFPIPIPEECTSHSIAFQYPDANLTPVYMADMKLEGFRMKFTIFNAFMKKEVFYGDVKKSAIEQLREFREVAKNHLFDSFVIVQVKNGANQKWWAFLK